MPPLTAQKEKSLIERLPVGLQSRALRQLSANANAPGGCLKQTNGRAQARLLKRAAELGIFLIEARVTAALAASIGGQTPPDGASVTLASTGMTPATTNITASEQDAVTWAAGGAKTITVSAPAGMKGEAVVTV